MGYSQTIVIGTGRVACACVQALLKHTDAIVMIEPEVQPFSAANALCSKAGIDHHVMTALDEIAAFFSTITVPSLVVSAHNNYIFPSHIIDNPTLTIVNFHNSLLPRHAGRNAPSWAIFEMDATAGISWHKVAAAVDAGDLIDQRSLAIAPNATAYSLTKQLADLGMERFRSLAPRLLANTYTPRPQPHAPTARLHFSHEVPNDGVLDLSWNVAKTSAFLRSLDYGKLSIYPPPTVRILGNEFILAGYDIAPSSGRSGTPRIDVNPESVALDDGTCRISITLKRVPESA